MKSAVPKRIVSLVPSQTELLFDLGLDEEVVGITKFCVHPNEWFRTKTRVGGTKTVDIDNVKALKPDLIIANKEENIKEQVEELATIAPVYTSDIVTLGDAFEMILKVGKFVGKKEKSKEIVQKIKLGFDELKAAVERNHVSKNSVSANELTKVAYLIWKDPYMAAGGDTFINDMLRRCGFENVFKNVNRYPQVDSTATSSISSSPSEHLLFPLDCHLLFLSSEPYPFKQKHVDELQALLPNTKILLVDGEMFSWYGSRLIKAASYFQELIANVYK